MLDIVEAHLRSMNAARSDADVTRVLADVARDLGFRSAYLIEYAGKLSATPSTCSTPTRRGAAGGATSSPATCGPRRARSRLGAGKRDPRAAATTPAASAVAPSACAPPARRTTSSTSSRCRSATAANWSGSAGFCGEAPLSQQQETALQLIAYNAFAHIRSARGGASAELPISR